MIRRDKTTISSMLISKNRNPKSRWLVYILECSDGSYYTGVTTDLDNRVRAHNKKRGAKYTRSRLPVRVVKVFNGLTHSEALKLEYSIKRKTREQKRLIIKGEI